MSEKISLDSSDYKLLFLLPPRPRDVMQVVSFPAG